MAIQTDSELQKPEDMPSKLKSRGTETGVHAQEVAFNSTSRLSSQITRRTRRVMGEAFTHLC